MLNSLLSKCLNLAEYCPSQMYALHLDHTTQQFIHYTLYSEGLSHTCALREGALACCVSFLSVPSVVNNDCQHLKVA